MKKTYSFKLKGDQIPWYLRIIILIVVFSALLFFVSVAFYIITGFIVVGIVLFLIDFLKKIKLKR